MSDNELSPEYKAKLAKTAKIMATIIVTPITALTLPIAIGLNFGRWQESDHAGWFMALVVLMVQKTFLALGNPKK